MKKGLLAIAMLVVLGLVANVALTEKVYFPYWQHGWTCETMFSISNAHETEDAVVTISLRDLDGAELLSTTYTVAPGKCVIPDTYEPWYQTGIGAAPDQVGFGFFDISPMPEDCIYLWGCVYANLAGTIGGQPGFTLVLPQNPYGAGL